MTQNDLALVILLTACSAVAFWFAWLGVLLYREVWLPVWRRWRIQIDADREAAQWDRMEKALLKARDRELRAWRSNW